MAQVSPVSTHLHTCNIVKLLEDLRLAGLQIRLDGGQIRVKPRPDADMTSRITLAKADLVKFLEAQEPRAVTEEEKSTIDSVFAKFKRQHGKALLTATWDRMAVFGKDNPTAVATVDDIPGVIALLMGGYLVVGITADRLQFRDPHGDRVDKLRGGVLVGGASLAATN